MIEAFEKTKKIKHPRDVGTAREEIVRTFLTRTGLLPARYAVSDTSVRVASTTGHLSKELDLLIIDSLDSISLMREDRVYDVFPVEVAYGTIQVKSKATKKDIRDGLLNIASFKSLKRHSSHLHQIQIGMPKCQSGFGILFAFDTDLDWVAIVAELTDFARETPSKNLCNAVVILTKGILFFGDDKQVALSNSSLTALTEPLVHERPDRDDTCLYGFYSILMELLAGTAVEPAPIQQYFRLPLTAGPYSYEYEFGSLVEYDVCEKHGDFQRKFTEQKLESVINWCKEKSKPTNWIRAIDIAYGRPGDNEEAYKRQPGEVLIYNPNDLPLSDVLVMDQKMNSESGVVAIKRNAFDAIRSDGLTFWIPYYYQISEDLISTCPKCAREEEKS